VFLALSIWLQLAKGLGAFETGLQFLSFAGVTMVAAPLAGILSSRFGAKWIVTFGMLLESLALFWISRILYFDAPTNILTGPLMLYGMGLGFAIAQLANIVLSDIPAEKAGVGSGATNTLRQLGASLGIALIGAVLFSTFADAATPLVQQSTAFDDFAARVQASETISDASKTLAEGITQFEDQAKEAIVEGLQANEGFDTSDSSLEAQLANIPQVARLGLRLSGVNLDDPEQVSQIVAELTPDYEILQNDLRTALGRGFSTAGRASALVASILVLCGALSSLSIPNVRVSRRVAAAVAAH
jgi:hypothetical protein